MPGEDEAALFSVVLNELGLSEMVNQAIEITLIDAEGNFDSCAMSYIG
jgi:hypothetical protein